MLDGVPIDIRARGPEAVEEYENGYYHGCRIVPSRDRGKPGRFAWPRTQGHWEGKPRECPGSDKVGDVTGNPPFLLSLPHRPSPVGQ